MGIISNVLFAIMFLSLVFPLFAGKATSLEIEASAVYPVHNLNTGLNYTTIQEAIDANETLDGDMIHVDAGIYNESVLISKSISLAGNGGNTTIIDGYGALHAVSIKANNVTFSGFTVEEGGRGLNIIINGGIFIISNNCRVYDNTIRYSDNYGAGIQLPGDFVSGNIVENNTVTNCTYGILSGGNNCELTNNIVKNCYSGAAVQGNNNVLRNNSFADNRFDFRATGIQDIDETNLVSGKPIIYWIDQQDRTTPPNTGYVSLVNCVNITVAGMISGRVSNGISLVNTNNSLIKDAILSDCQDSCIYLFNSSGNTINNSSFYSLSDLIDITSSNSNRIDRNVFNGSIFGVSMRYSEHNSITGNLFENNYESVYFNACNDVSVYHNNFINSSNAHLTTFGTNLTLDNGLEGNWWDDYNGTDSNADGIGDTPYVINANNIDHYPLMGTFQSFNVPKEVDVISNIAIASIDLREWLSTPNQYLHAGQSYLALTLAEGQSIGTGFCRITFPNDILNTSDYAVVVNMTAASFNKLAISNDTYTTLYFTFNSSALDGIIVVPEFPSFLLLATFMTAILLTIIVYRKKHSISFRVKLGNVFPRLSYVRSLCLKSSLCITLKAVVCEERL